jgi:hypothetical protein
VTLSDIQRGNTALISHQMLHLPRTPDRIQPPEASVLRLGATAPKRIFQANCIKNLLEADPFVVGLSFTGDS